MFITEEYFQTFSERPVPKGDTTQVLIAISLNNREEVDQIVNKAVENVQHSMKSRRIMDGCIIIHSGISTVMAGMLLLQTFLKCLLKP